MASPLSVGSLAGAVGRGLFAGFAGTAAMTLSSTVEMKVRKRGASSAPARAAAKVLGVEPRSDADWARFSNLVHWCYGTGWGAVRGVLGALGLGGPAGAASHFGLVWGSELVMLPALGVTPPVKEWGSTEVAIDAFHHTVYVTATSLVFAWISRRPER